MTAELRGVDNVLIEVGDVERARDHYRALGFVEKFAFSGLVGFAIGDERPGLVVREVQGLAESDVAIGPHLWIEVADAAALAAHLGIADIREIRTGRVFEVTDPWGNTVGFTDYAHDPARARPREV